MADGLVVAVCASAERGVRKKPQEMIELRVGEGVAGDGHAGAWHRQLSLLPAEAVDELRPKLAALAGGSSVGTASLVAGDASVDAPSAVAGDTPVTPALAGDVLTPFLATSDAPETPSPSLPDLGPGAFAENILTRGLDLKALGVGAVLQVGEALVAVTQIGKQCHNDCEIKRLVGRCAMPSEGIFAVVIRGGRVRAGDVLRVIGEDEL